MTSASSRFSLGLVGALGLLSSGAGTPALAAPAVDGCGDAPLDGELTRTGEVCQVVFDEPGLETTWTVPAGLTTIHAVVTGAGGGAYTYGVGIGYAGDGGEVRYVDLSSTSAGSSLPVEVGAPGASTPRIEDVSVEAEVQPAIAEPSITPGGNSLLGVTEAAGGAAVDLNDYCFVFDGGYFRAGVGAAEQRPEAKDCELITGAGIAPATDPDSGGLAALSLFSTYEGEHGRGGVANTTDYIATAAELTTLGLGTGAGMRLATVAEGTSLTPVDAAGGSVIIRYNAVDEPEAEDAAPEAEGRLAATGASESGGVLGLATVLIAAGVALFALNRRRARAD